MILLSKIIGSQNALNQLLSYDLPVEIAWELSVFVKKLQPEIEAYDKEKLKLLKKYGEKTEKGGMEVKDLKSQEKVISELSPLLEKEVKIKIPKVDHKELAANEELKIPGSIFLTLDWLFS